MYMPFMVDVERAVVFGGERDEGLQKTEKMAVFADELLVVPETDDAPSEITLEAGPLERVPESLSLEESRTIPVADEPASQDNIPGYVEGATFVTSDLEDESLNTRIEEAAGERNILCNIIDVKEKCDTWFVSVIDTPNMIAGISTKGGCAFYSQRTRIELEEEFETRSRVSKLFTELRDELRSGQCNLCALQVVYDDDRMQQLMEDGEWDRAYDLGVEKAQDVPDGFHLMDHSVSDA
ncbi:MAG: bifunctional precorrin-2 dehydrogenase/sirohydrochlorin ferrochelatase [bacterium]